MSSGSTSEALIGRIRSDAASVRTAVSETGTVRALSRLDATITDTYTMLDKGLRYLDAHPDDEVNTDRWIALLRAYEFGCDVRREESKSW